MNSSLLKRSFEPIILIADDFVDHFYCELFRSHPELRSFFSVESFPEQKMKLAESLGFIVENIEDLDILKRYLVDLGRRHVHYGVIPEQLSWVGQALIATLIHFYADNWTEELEQTWLAAFSLISDAMMEGMEKMNANAEAAQGDLIELDRADGQRHQSGRDLKKEGSAEVAGSESQGLELRARVDQLAAEILFASMERQAQEVAVRVVASLKDTYLSELVRDEVARQAKVWVGQLIQAAVEAEASQLISARAPSRNQVA